MYGIGDFSKLSQIPVRTLRYYDGIGLLRPARVERWTGYRYYAAAQLEQLNRILVFKDLGFSLREIRALVAENVPADQIRGMLRLKHHELEHRAERERARLTRAAARLDLIDRCGPRPAQDVALRGFGGALVASVRDTLASHDECERLFDELERQTGGQRPPGRRGAIWHACSEGAIDCEALVFLAAPIDASGRVRVYEMPAHRVASLVYRGDGDFMRAYDGIRAWIATAGVEVTGPKREIYLESGGRDRESVTEIQFPLSVESGRVH